MKEIKKENAITLIALVITIIVLLILAGVVISMLSGENGLLNQAARAKVEIDEKSIEEQINLAVQAAITNKNHEVNEEDLKEELGKYGLKLDEDVSEAPYVITEGEIKYTIQSNGEITKEKVSGGTGEVATSIPVEDYGKEVTNYEVPEEDFKDTAIKWKIFLEDGENIYLIADNYVQRTMLPPTTDETTLNDGSYPRAAYFTNILSKYNGSSDIVGNTKLPQKYNKWANLDAYKTSTNNNIKSVAYMLDTNIWKAYANSKYADYAIGGPTIEMFRESYNKTHSDKTIEYNENNETGYKVKWSTDASFNTYISGLNTSESLYIISGTSNAYGYWLASPSANNSESVMNVSNNGYVGRVDYSIINRYAFCPVICLKSNVHLQKIGKDYQIMK